MDNDSSDRADPANELTAEYVDGQYRFHKGSEHDDDSSEVEAFAEQAEYVSPYTIEGAIAGVGRAAAGANRKGGFAKRLMQAVAVSYAAVFLVPVAILIVALIWAAITGHVPFEV